MGYRRKRKEYRLTFADPEYEGLEIIMGSLTVQQFMDLTEAWGQGGDSAGYDAMLKMVASQIISWNLEDDFGDFGDPVPASLDGLKSLDMDFVGAVVMAWMNAIAGVPRPLPGNSSGSGGFPEASIPMAPLSPNPPS